MNKHRKHYRPDAAEVKLCIRMIDGRGCTFGNQCKFSHDIAAYCATRQPDLGETCPIYTLRGECRFGVMCRFGSAHLDLATGANRTMPVDVAPPEEVNIVSPELVQRLRKKKYDFAKTDALAEKITLDLIPHLTKVTSSFSCVGQ